MCRESPPQGLAGRLDFLYDLIDDTS